MADGLREAKILLDLRAADPTD
jgi:dual specificity tyrosine-phosphorylation-regulated kinase 2/3/4